MIAATLLVVAALAVWLIAPHIVRAVLLSRLPRVNEAKLTHSVLSDVADRPWPLGLVRLPGKHGCLVTDPALARRLLECNDGSVVREVAAYSRYEAFLGGALVVLPQATILHRSLRSALLRLFNARLAHATLLNCTERLMERLDESVTKELRRGAIDQAGPGAAVRVPLQRGLR